MQAYLHQKSTGSQEVSEVKPHSLQCAHTKVGRVGEVPEVALDTITFRL